MRLAENLWPVLGVVTASFLLTGAAVDIRPGSQRQTWGTGVTREECTARGGPERLEKILSGDVEPYAFTGPPAVECTAEGCKHDYWGPRCRWTGRVSPTCPKEEQERLIELLKQSAAEGAAWASNALALQPCELWEAIQGHTVWFVGDSTSQESAHSFLCFLVEYMDMSRPAPKISDDKYLMHRLTHNANNNEVATWCALLQSHTRLCLLRVNFGPRMANVMLPALAQVAEPQDFVVLNFGLWSNRLEELQMHTSIFEAAFHYYRDQLPRRTFWRETTAQHFSTMSGIYDITVPIAEQRCRPMFPGVNITIAANGSLVPASEAEHLSPAESTEYVRLLSGGHRNLITQPAIDRLGLHTIPTWNVSASLWSFHHDVHNKDDPQVCANIPCDCTHSCQPSWAQLFLPGFYQAFKSSEYLMAGGRAQ